MIKTLWLSLILTLLLTARSNADLISYRLEITSGVAHTLGGFSGNGIGDLAMEGTFKLHTDPDRNYATMEDIDVFPRPLGFDWSSLSGTVSGGVISLATFLGPLPNHLGGTFDGSLAVLTGRVNDVGCNDCLTYQVNFSATATSLAADFNGDNYVTAADLGQWEGDYSSNGDSDANGDGESSGMDFLEWQRGFERTSALSTATAVPEPATCGLALAATLCLEMGRRRIQMGSPG